MSDAVRLAVASELLRWLVGTSLVVALGLVVRSVLLRSRDAESVDVPSFVSGSSSLPELAELLDTAVEVEVKGSTDMDSARFYCYTPSEGWRFLSEGIDVYELLDQLTRSTRHLRGRALFGDEEGLAFGVVTTGWCAPLDENGESVGAPSDHPLRVRVRVSLVSDGDASGSCIAFDDRRPRVAGSEGTGRLDDEFRATVRAVLGRS